jgi:hypothetical protein
VHLSRQGIERYQPGPTTDPPVDPSIWSASFDGGNTWRDADVVNDAPTWLVAGPDAVSPGSAIVLADTAWIVPALRFTNGAEIIIRDASFDEEHRPPAIYLTA